MKLFFTKNINKIAMIAVLIVVVGALASCRQGSWPTTPYTTWAAEWKFSGFWQGLWGWPVALLSYPIAWLMGTIGRLCGNSYAWGIVFTTIIVRTIAWPIYSKQNSTSLKMTLLQPEMEKIQRKYQNRKDPESQQRMQQETLALYKKYKMNPFGCGFTMILQFPLFMAMYECVRRIQLTETLDGVVSAAGRFTLANTKLFGFFDINTAVMGQNDGIAKASAWQDIFFGILVAVLFSAVTLLSQKLASKPPKYQKQRRSVKTQGQEQQQKTMKYMNYFMVLMFFFMSLSSTALSLYWLIGGVYQLFQSQVGRKLNERAYYKAQEKNNII